VAAPTIAIHPPPELERLKQAVGQLSTYDWVVFTSANGVLQAFSQLSAQNLDARAFGRAKLAAIGPKTAASLSQYGLRADHVATSYVGEVLAEGLVAHSPKRVLLLRALEARDTLPTLLRRAGVAVDVVSAYATAPVAEPERARLVRTLQSQRVDAVLFTASSTVTSLLDLLGPAAAEFLENVVIASIGPVTSETARKQGLRVDVTAEQYTVDGLLDALELYYAIAAPAEEGPAGLPFGNR
jgi:uroporphyrinogen III methyltransferase/synthase